MHYLRLLLRVGRFGLSFPLSSSLVRCSARLPCPFHSSSCRVMCASCSCRISRRRFSGLRIGLCVLSFSNASSMRLRVFLSIGLTHARDCGLLPSVYMRSRASRGESVLKNDKQRGSSRVPFTGNGPFPSMAFNV